LILVEADAGEEWDSRIGWAALADEAVRAAIRCSDYEMLADNEAEIEISVKFTSNDEVQALNAAYRARDKPTNVLSFPMVEPALLDAVKGMVLLGDVVLAHGVCAQEAAAKSVAIETHASHLLVHGTLHLLGYDHEQGYDRAEAMEDVERAALATIGIADPYAITEVQS
jgi:probable rRNA maturation factor